MEFSKNLDRPNDTSDPLDDLADEAGHPEDEREGFGDQAGSGDDAAQKKKASALGSHPTAPVVRGASFTQAVSETQEMEVELERRKAIEEKITLQKRKREEKEEKARKRHKPNFV